MNFFEYQARARVRTRWLVALYLLAMALIVLAVYAVVVVGWKIYVQHEGGEAAAAGIAFWNPLLFEGVALCTCLLILGGTLYKILTLADGGVAVARLLGGVPVYGDTANQAETQLLNVTAEMAIAAGVPMPQVFVLPEERGLNALIAGDTPNDAALIITRGALDRFHRDELQAVVAHEISHVLNGDMRLNLAMVGMLHGIQLMALIGHGLLWPVLMLADPDEADDTEGDARVSCVLARTRVGLLMLLTGGILLLIGYFGVFLANLIKAAISREREYLADAEAVQFTRNPLALTRALKKIGARSMGGCLRTPEAAQTNHMFIASAAPDWWFSPFNTHPDLVTRIRRFEPSFDGDFARVRARLQQNDPAWAVAPMPVYQPSDAFRDYHRHLDLIAPCKPDLTYAAALLQGIPQGCCRLVTRTEGAQAVLFGLLISSQPEVAREQLAVLAAGAPGDVYAHLSVAKELCAAMPEASRIPLADQAVNALRRLEPEAYPQFRENLLAMVVADQALDLFELVLLHMVTRRLDRHFGVVGQPCERYETLAEVRESIGVVLSALAWNGTEDPVSAAAAYAQGWIELRENPVVLHAQREVSLPLMEEHLGRLAELAPQLKACLLAACTRCVAADGKTTLSEAETLRAIADALECPVPPFAPDGVACITN